MRAVRSKEWSAADVQDPLRPRPKPIPPPDQHQVERLNSLYEIAVPHAEGRGWRGQLIARLRAVLARVFFCQQQDFNAALVDHVNRNVNVAMEAHQANVLMIDWVETIVNGAVDDLRRHREALLARERRSESAVAALSTSHDELRAAVGVLQQAAQNLKRELGQRAQPGLSVARSANDSRPDYKGVSQIDAIDSHKYVVFEDQFRGSQEDIRARVAEYLSLFQGASDVLDIGCGRGEFLRLLKEHGISARGVDINGAMVGVCRDQGLDATEGDALKYLRLQQDGSLGGLFAAQVVEHLEPSYLTDLLDVAFDKLKPGSPIVLETINPGCWFAFFESYLRDPTHVQPIHPDTLKYLLIASGFQRVEIRYRAPYPEHEKLQPLPVSSAAPIASVTDWIETINANVEKINRLLFTWLDYAAIGHRA
jgi:SAM-dependent methyltransferase